MAKIQLRGDSLNSWNSANPTLGNREVALVSTKNNGRYDNFKIGDGSSKFSDLPYFLEGATFMGTATPNTNPGTPDRNVFYLAAEPGVYENFGGVEVKDDISVISLVGGIWKVSGLGIPVNEMGVNISKNADSIEKLSRLPNIALTNNYLTGNIFTIQGKLIQNDGSYRDWSAFRCTPLIAIDAIKGARESGILIESGTFRCPVSSDYSVATFYDSSGNVLSYYSNSITYSKAASFPADSIPREAVYVAFNQYSVKDAVILRGFNLTDQFKRLISLENDIKKVNSLSFIVTNLMKAQLSNTTYYGFGKDAEYTTDGDELVFSAVKTVYSVYKQIDKLKFGHKFYSGVMMKTPSSKDALKMQSGTVSFSIQAWHPGDNEWHWLSECLNIGDNLILATYFLSTDASDLGTRTVSLKWPVVIDLTECFGEGNEPSKEEVDTLFSTMSEWFGVQGSFYETSGLSEYMQSRKVNDVLLLTKAANPITDIIITPKMALNTMIKAYNSALDSFSELCKCAPMCMNKLEPTDSIETICESINHNFRSEVVSPEMSAVTFCNRVNSAFSERIFRFCDAKIPKMSRDFSLTTGVQADEPSAIVGPDGKLYIYAHLMRFSTEDGLNWSEPEATPLSGGSIKYLMHNGVCLIDGIYYLIGTNLSSMGGYYMFTSTDGVNFNYAGKLFDAGIEVADGVTVKNWGNPYLIKNYGDGKWYLYYEYQAEGRFWEIALATCTDIMHTNEDGTIGDWVQSDANPVIALSPYQGVRSAGNPDFAKLMDNNPLKHNGRYYLYYHSTWQAQANICRAYSEDLIHWHDEGIILDIRDIPTAGDTSSGNADHCVIEYKGRTYMFYSWDINSANLPYIKYVVDDRPFHEILSLRP